MTDVPDRRDIGTKQAQEELSRLNGQVAAMRGVLTQLLQDVVRADILLEGSQARQLLEANEQLVISALGAQADAQRAASALDEARTGGLDELTGLPNSAVLLDRLKSAISHSKRHGHRVALLALDLDGIQQLNDVSGPTAADQALRLVAERLRSLVRETDTVSRLGSNQFLILLAEVAQASDAAVVAQKVNTTLGDYGQTDDSAGRLTASMGISVYPEDGVDAKTLIDQANAAMCVAQKLDLGGFVFHTDQSPEQSSSPTPPARYLTQHQLEMAAHEQRHDQRRETNEQLVLAALGAQELLAAAEDMRRRQATLLSLVANELSNPLAPIRLAAATLGRHDAEETLLPRVQAIIEEHADKISRMVIELLDPRQGGKAQSLAGRKIIDLAALIDAAIETCQPAIDKRQQTLKVMISRPLEMNGNPSLLLQVLVTLLADASLYTDHGGRIRVGAEIVDDRLLLTIADSGREILPEAKSAALDPFVLPQRVDRVDEDGIRMRLMGVSEIIELQGGTVIAMAVGGGRGSQFRVSIPSGRREGTF